MRVFDYLLLFFQLQNLMDAFMCSPGDGGGEGRKKEVTEGEGEGWRDADVYTRQLFQCRGIWGTLSYSRQL